MSRALAPLLLAAITTVLAASVGAAGPGGAAGATAAGAAAEGGAGLETVTLHGGPASLAGALRVHVEGPYGASSSVFGPVPDRAFFSRLPVPPYGGVGTALRDEALSGYAVWLAFSVENATSGERWFLVGDGAGFNPSALVVVDERGASERFAGDSLERLRLSSGLEDVVAYGLGLPSGERRAVYVRLEGAAFGAGLNLWPAEAIEARVEKLVRVQGLLAGFALAACAAFAFVSSRPGPASARPRYSSALGLAFSSTAFLAVALGAGGGGVSALTSGAGLPRYAASVALGLAAISLEAAMALVQARGRGRAGQAVVARVIVPRLAFATTLLVSAVSTASPLASYALPVGLACLVGLRGALAAAAYSGRALAGMEEAARLTVKLESEMKGGRDFMTATAAALRAPLNGLVATLEDLDAILAECPAIPGPATSDLALARAEASRLDTLVSNILSYSGIGPARLSIEDFDLSSVARSAAGLLRVAISGRGVRIDVDLPILELRSDIGVSHRLLYTAMSRAAGNEGTTTVRVRASSGERGATLTVEYDGASYVDPGAGALPGVEPALDMDLAVMSRLASQLGGAFYRRVEGDRGAYVIELPRTSPADGEAGPAERGARPPARPSSRPIAGPLARGIRASVDLGASPSPSPARAAGRILVAGNEPVALLSMKRRLESSGWLVYATVSANEALERLLGEDPYDIAIVDSVMPEMSGFKFCESVRASRLGESVPLIVLIESGRPDEIELAFRSGASDYIARPASGLELAVRVKTHVELAASVKRELEQAARMAEFDKYRTLAMLSAGVAHEINTPNNAVLRNVPMLKEIWSALETVVERLNREEGGFSVRGFGYDDLRREIPDILNDLYMGAQDIKKIVEGLKDYARSPSDSKSYGLVDVNDAVRYSARLLKHSIVVSTSRFETALAEGLPRVRADRLKLTQVIVNVLENALQSLPDPSRGVRVESSSRDEGDGSAWVAVRVTDEGVGMPPETLASAFDPFFTTKRDRGGSGLGLPVASGIVQDLGGSIELRSAPGAGTTATIRIPASGRDEDGDDGRC
ncbi:MAG: response regulator [Spirochaetes bacterium]|nr:response regulator [Spirochaetota bacterium]MBU1079700.1 response regulator [Spirochaetota bacterium]